MLNGRYDDLAPRARDGKLNILQLISHRRWLEKKTIYDGSRNTFPFFCIFSQGDGNSLETTSLCDTLSILDEVDRYSDDDCGSKLLSRRVAYLFFCIIHEDHEGYENKMI